jgi:hypothetical protein
VRIKLFGRYWNLVRQKLPRTKDGFCDPPGNPGKQIRVGRTLRGQRELEVYIHEMLHACDFHKDEPWVETTANDITQVLWRLGYRKGPDGESPEEVEEAPAS